MKRPRPRKVIATALVFLLLGAVVNVAVAWGCVFVSQPAQRWDDFTEWEVPSDGERWVLITANDFGHARIASYRFRGVAREGDREWPPLHHEGPPSWSTLSTASEAFIAGRQQSDAAMEDGCGWPVYSLRCRYIIDVSQGFDHRRVKAIKYAIAVPPLDTNPAPGSSYSNHVFPLVPLWPGFAINTLFYAAILWSLFAAPFALRRMRRIKRGLCPACAYPVGTSDLCTECGKPVTPPPPEGKRLKAA